MTILLREKSQIARVKMETSVTKARIGRLDTGVSDGDGEKYQIRSILKDLLINLISKGTG